MADPPVRSQAAVVLDHLAEQDVGMQVALHDRVDFAGEDHRDGAGGRRCGSGDRLDLEVLKVGVDRLAAALISSGSPIRIGSIRPRLAESSAPPSESLSSGPDDGGFQRRSLAARE